MKKQLILASVLIGVCSAVFSAPPKAPAPVAPAPSGGVDINTGTTQSLQTDLGLNEAEANAIVEYRKKKGPLNTETQLRSVPGLGSGGFDKLKGRVIFSNPVLDTSGRSVERFIWNA